MKTDTELFQDIGAQLAEQCIPILYFNRSEHRSALTMARVFSTAYAVSVLVWWYQSDMMVDTSDQA